MSMPLPAAIVQRPAEYSASYRAEMMFDASPGTYFCTPNGVVFPVVFVLQLSGPAVVESLILDTRVSGYETSAPRDVVVELQNPATPGMFQPVCAGLVMMGQVCTVPLPQAMVATAVRLVIRSNHGGTYVAISTLAVMGSAAGMMGAQPYAQPGVGYPQTTGYPAAPGYPQPQGFPPAYPQAPGAFPQQPAYPQAPGAFPQQPGYPAAPGAFPQQPGYPAAPTGYPQALPQQAYPAMQQGYPQAVPTQGFPGQAVAAGFVGAQSVVYPAGTHVSAQWGQGGSWWPAVITQWNGAQYEVQWDQGGTREWVAPTMLRPG